MACVSGTVRWILLPVLSFCVGFLFLPRSSIYSAEGGIKNPLGSKSQFEKGALGETKNKRIREMMTGPSVSPSFSLLTSSIFLVDCLYNARLCALCIFVFEKLFPPQTEITFSFWYCSRIPSSSFSLEAVQSRTKRFQCRTQLLSEIKSSFVLFDVVINFSEESGVELFCSIQQLPLG